MALLFADLKGSLELLADRDPEEARRILDPVLELMMQAVHRYEGTVNRVLGDRIMALFGAALAPLKRLVIEGTEGNPFFLEETVRSLVETGVPAGERGAYRPTRVVHGLQVPATAQAMLADRIDRLSPEDKRLLQAAPVIGTDVPFELLRDPPLP